MRRVAPAVAVCTAAVLLAGCGNDPEPDPIQRPPATESPSPLEGRPTPLEPSSDGTTAPRSPSQPTKGSSQPPDAGDSGVIPDPTG